MSSDKFYRPNYGNETIAMYDPTNFEHGTFDSISEEHIQMTSPKILWWKIDQKETLKNNDDLSNLYGESEMISYTNISEPIRVYMFAEASPIIEELNRMGLAQAKEMNFMMNKTDTNERLGRLPISGDIFRMSMIERNGLNRQEFYKVVSAVDTDLNLWRYTHLMINAEQTSMTNIPKKIRDYLNKD